MLVPACRGTFKNGRPAAIEQIIYIFIKFYSQFDFFSSHREIIEGACGHWRINKVEHVLGTDLSLPKLSKTFNLNLNFQFKLSKLSKTK